MTDSLAALDALIDNVEPGATVHWQMSGRTWRRLWRLARNGRVTMARTVDGASHVRRVLRSDQQRYQRDGWHPVPKRRWKNAMRRAA